MGLLFDYFVAASDREAAETIAWVGGPGAGDPAEQRSGYEIVDGKGIDPVVKLGAFEELVTGRTFDERLADVPSEPLAIRDEGDGWVLPLSVFLVDGLAATDETTLTSLVPRWATIEEFQGAGRDVDDLTSFVLGLQTLAREARSNGGHVYCWFSL